MAGKHRAPRRSQRTTETSDYVAMMIRIIAGENITKLVLAAP
jgi:hypothetical protein